MWVKSRKNRKIQIHAEGSKMLISIQKFVFFGTAQLVTGWKVIYHHMEGGTSKSWKSQFFEDVGKMALYKGKWLKKCEFSWFFQTISKWS